MQTRDLHRPQKPFSPLAACLQGGCLLLVLGLGYLALRTQPTGEGTPTAIYDHTPPLRPTFSDGSSRPGGALGASIEPWHGTLPPEERGRVAALEGADPDVDVLLGVITNPPNFDRREMLRDFGSKPGVADGRVKVEYVVGDTYYTEPPGAAMQQRMAKEVEEHGDVVLVQAREALPHVGKATEKSAAWWLSAPLRSNARFFCKTDDDSLVHLSHLRSALLAALEQAPVSHLIFSYIRWRGWLPGFRFQACGGGWGGPLDAIHQMEDPGAGCALAEGPFPQGTGTLTCISRDLAVKMARSEEFKTFLQVAKARNDMGTPCHKADECAAQKLDVHMWHHEDAGISYNAWRTVLAHGVKAALVHLPEKGWIWPWYHKEIAEKQGSSRGIIMHKVTPELYPIVTVGEARWKLAEPAPRSIVDCSQRCSQWGWKYAYRSCEPPAARLVAGAAAGAAGFRGFAARGNGSVCKFDPSEVWGCCFLRAPEDK